MQQLLIKLHVLLLPFKIDRISKNVILLELEPFSLKFGLIVFQNVLLSVMSFIFELVNTSF